MGAVHRLRRGTVVALALAGFGVLGAAPAGAAVRVKEITVGGDRSAAGPAAYDRTQVTAYGPTSAKRVLVLVPGNGGGRGSFALVAKDIVARVPGLQVWAWDRRQNALEDTSAFSMRDPDAAFGYYLNGKEVNGRKFTPVTAQDAPYAKTWGMGVAINDLKRVVRAARAGGRKVILGGHSLGASTALAYASWDFGGRAGWRDIAGLVLIDGGDFGFRTTLAEVNAGLADIEKGNAFLDVLGVGIPWAAGVFVEAAAQYARVKPRSVSPMRDYPLLPAALRPPVRVTNDGLLGYVLDNSYSSLASLQVHSGALAPTGDPRRWRDGESSPIQRVARVYGNEPGNAAEWYFPARLTLDFRALRDLRPSSASRKLGLRLKHASSVRVPLYAFQTDLTSGGVLRGAKRFVRSSRVPFASYASQTRFAHLDPLTASPSKSGFTRTVVPFLKRIR